uniref:Uncharacterized protein n=1 Tax=Arundo donax TaxID=35708 RepID=A0A0A9SNE7_ARUDO
MLPTTKITLKAQTPSIQIVSCCQDYTKED